MTIKLGYARVSTGDQNLDLQIDALERIDCLRIYTDRGVSGATLSRPGLDAVMRRLRPGYTLVVWRLDRLGRSLRYLVDTIDRLGKRGVHFVSLMENIDTTSSGGVLLFHMMAALAQFERSLISERTKAGLAVARANGKQLGRRRAMTPEQCAQAWRAVSCEGAAYKDVAAAYAVHPRTLYRALEAFRRG